jgi:hypothetical protein
MVLPILFFIFVHVGVTKALIELKFDMHRLTEMVLNPGIKVQAILDRNEARKQSKIDLQRLLFQFPVANQNT